MGATSIEWTDHSVNPIRARNKATGKVGHFCEKISPGCKNCYASQMQKGPYLSGLEYITGNRDKVEFFLDEKRLHQVIRRKKPTKYFWCDMTDMFLADYPDEWIDACFAAMALTPQHTHQVLTKRPERMAKYFTGETSPYFYAATRIEKESWRLAYKCGADQSMMDWPLPDVWLGVSVESQAYKHRIDILRETPAAVRFLSIEPLLEGIGDLDLRGIHLVIVGGESGPKARPFNLRWAHCIIEQCRVAGVACFIKQAGSKPCLPSCADIQCTHPDCDPGWLKLKNRKGGDMSEWPKWMQVRQLPEARHA